MVRERGSAAVTLPGWHEIDALFSAALDLPPAERRAFLEQQCAGRDQLLAAVLALLDSADSAASFLETPVFTLDGGFPALQAPAAGPPDPDLLRLSGRDVSHFRVLEVVGSGGAGIVYRAHDARLDRHVALKFLLPQLRADPGAAERFLSEGRAASSLDHPSTCVIHEAGVAEDGQPFIAMAFYEGETLRERIARAGPLDCADAAAIARRIADGLAAAHAAGLVHRDLKPGNVMLVADGGVKILDFGLARVRDGAANRTGERSGTVAYMSPEQLRGERLDARSDLWSLGVVLFEMLAGLPPFGGGHELATVHAILNSAAPSIRSFRPDVPPALASIVARLLQHDPADRYASAADVARDLAAFPGAGSVLHAAGTRPHGRARTGRLALLLGGLALVALSGAWLAWSRGRAAAPAPDPDLVAILPFRVSAEPSLAYLGEGMLDLLSAALPQDGSIHVIDARNVLALWQRSGAQDTDIPLDSALSIARRLGAGSVVLGGVVGTPARITITAQLRDVGSARARASARIEGAADSVPVLADRLARQIVAGSAGEGEDRVSLLADVPMLAVRDYLEGRAAARRGMYADAVDSHSAALARDSAFVLPALDITILEGWITGAVPDAVIERARRIAWQHRDRLSPADRAQLLALLGPRYPEPSSGRDAIEATRLAAELAPDRAELWFWYGDRLLHDGPPTDVPDAHRLALAAFDRALALDSNLVDPLNHRVEMALVVGDSAGALALTRRQLARDTTGETADMMRWIGALAQRDAAALERFRDRLRADLVTWPMPLAAIAQIHTRDVETARVAVASAVRAADSRARATALVVAARGFARNTGQSSAADAALREALRIDPGRASDLDVLAIADALFWDGDEGAAAEAAVRLEAVALRTASSAQAQRTQLAARCWREQWRLHNGQTTTAQATATALRAGRYHDPGDAAHAEFCARLLEAVQAFAARRPDASELIERVDSAAAALPPVPSYLVRAANLTIARMYEQRGDLSRALRAVRRYNGYETAFFSTLLREEARLADITGDRDGALRAYEHYILLRAHAEPTLRDDVERARTAAVRLASGSAR